MPIFRVKSVKIYTGQKNLHEPRSWARDKYEVCSGDDYDDDGDSNRDNEGDDSDRDNDDDEYIH